MPKKNESSSKPKVNARVSSPRKAIHSPTDNSAKAPERVQKVNQEPNHAPRKSGSSGFFARIAPYAFGVLSIFLFVCIILDIFGSIDVMGPVGKAITRALGGLWGFGAILLPFAIAFTALRWKSWREQEVISKRLISGVFALIVLSSVVGVIHIASNGFFIGISSDILPNMGQGITDMWTIGYEYIAGGVLGGIVAEPMYICFREGSLFILIPVLVVLMVIFLGLTPKNAWLYIKYRLKILAEKKAEERAIRKEQKEEEKALRAAEKQAEQERIEAENRANALINANDVDPLSSQNDTDNEFKDSVEDQTDACEDMVATKKKGFIIVKKEKSAADEIVSDEDSYCDPSDEEEENDIDDLQAVFGSSESTDSASTSDDSDAQPEADETEATEIPAENPEEAAPVYQFPPLSILAEGAPADNTNSSAEIAESKQRLLDTLSSFNVKIKSVDYSRGPTITRYELTPEAGVRVRTIANMIDDISLGLATTGVRIEAPIPNKSAVGIEVPNRSRSTVFLRSLIDTDDFRAAKSNLTVGLGSDVAGAPVFLNIAKMPHLLIAGATGMGKSVCINCMIVSLLYKASPEDVKLILIDPKKVEFNIYREIPHLYAPIVSDPKKAAGALASAVAEMERRFMLIEDVGMRDIAGYNNITKGDPEREHLPHMVIIIDELADLMMTAKEDVEASICRLAQKARAAGIHIIIGTQRPSVDVITGLIKANIPSRIACTVASQVDSRTIIDIAGAEKLIGRGDMLYAPVGIAKPMRVQGAFVDESEIEKIVQFLKAKNGTAVYNQDFISMIEAEAAKCGNKKAPSADMIDDSGASGDFDPKFREAVELAIEMGKISTSLMQRRLEVGYGRAAKLIDRMEQLGYVSAPDGNKPRRVLITMQEFMEQVVNDEVSLSGEQ